jgi:hypothetical protein
VVRFPFVLLLAALLGGCSHPPPRGLVQYLHQVEPYQQSLSTLLTDMKSIPQRAPSERLGAAKQLMGEIRERKSSLQAVLAPPAGSRMQSCLVDLYSTLESYTAAVTNSTGDPRDPRLRQLSLQWTRQIEVANKELDNLSRAVGH